MAVKHLYHKVTTDRPAELIAGLSAHRAHPAIPSKAENIRRIRRLIIEHPDFSLQPTYRELMVRKHSCNNSIQDPWQTIGSSPNAQRQTQRPSLTAYTSSYNAFVQAVDVLYTYVNSRPARTVFDLGALTFAKNSPIRIWAPGMLTLDPKDQERTNSALEFLIRTGAQHFCQRTTAGPLRIPAECDLPEPLPGQAPIDIHIHLTDLHFPPPITWNHPATWTYDPRRYRNTEPDPRTQALRLGVPTSEWQAFEARLLGLITHPLQMRDTGLSAGISPELLYMMSGLTPEQLKAASGSEEYLDIDIYASPHVKIPRSRIAGGFASADQLDADSQRIYARDLEQRLTARLGPTDRVRWKAAVDAPACKACGWTAIGVA